MRIELIQPFINATDAVLAEMLNGPAHVSEVLMDEEAYRRKGVAAGISIRGDIEGQVIFDLDPQTALHIAATLAGGVVEPNEQLACETVCELANIVVGNAVTLLNDQGHSFKVFPPMSYTEEKGFTGNRTSEALVMCFETPGGKVNLNISLDYSRQKAATAPQATT